MSNTDRLTDIRNPDAVFFAPSREGLESTEHVLSTPLEGPGGRIPQAREV